MRNLKTPSVPGLAQYLLNVGLALGIILLPLPTAWATDQSTAEPTAPFNDRTLKSWQEKSFSGNTHYEIVELDGTRVLKGSTEGAASILYKEQPVDLSKKPIISWSWKIDGVYDDIDEKTRAGDDFPARLYVVSKTGILPWQTLAINYVWSSEQDVGDSWSNPFTEKAKMIVVQSGNSNAGQWVSQTRNVAEDFKKHFGKDIKKIDGYAVMVDGDNANKTGTAWYADISFSEE